MSLLPARALAEERSNRVETADGADAANAPGGANAEAAADNTHGAPAADRASNASTPILNPLAHTGLYYWGVLQRALGMSDDSPVKLGGIVCAGPNWLASGGLKPHLVTGDLIVGFGAFVDMQKLINFPGGDLYAGFLNYQGARTNLAAGSVQVYDGNGVASHFSRQELYELWWRQRLLDDKVVIRAGKMPALGEFGVVWAPVYNPDPKKNDWMNSGLLWGAVGTFQPTNNTYIKYGMFDGNNANFGGWETGRSIGPHLNNGYKFHIGQVGFSWQLGEEGKAGQIGLGAWAQTGKLLTPDGAAVKDDFLGQFAKTSDNGARGFYAFGSQRLWHQHPGVDPNGVIGWWQFGYTNSLTSEATRFASAGLTGLGLIPGRLGDAISVDVAWSKLNPQATTGVVFLALTITSPPLIIKPPTREDLS